MTILTSTRCLICASARGGRLPAVRWLAQHLSLRQHEHPQHPFPGCYSRCILAGIGYIAESTETRNIIDEIALGNASIRIRPCGLVHVQDCYSRRTTAKMNVWTIMVTARVRLIVRGDPFNLFGICLEDLQNHQRRGGHPNLSPGHVQL